MPLRTQVFALMFALGAGAVAAHAEEPDSGAQLYVQFECEGCHEYEAIQGFEVVVLHDLATRYDTAALAQLLADPPPSMPAIPMNAEQREALARYLRERFP